MKDTIVRILTDERDQARADSTEIAGKFTKACARIRELEKEQWLVAECIFQNVSAGEMKHWAQGIKVSLSGADKVPRFTVEREAK